MPVLYLADHAAAGACCLAAALVVEAGRQPGMAGVWLVTFKVGLGPATPAQLGCCERPAQLHQGLLTAELHRQAGMHSCTAYLVLLGSAW